MLTEAALDSEVFKRAELAVPSETLNLRNLGLKQDCLSFFIRDRVRDTHEVEEVASAIHKAKTCREAARAAGEAWLWAGSRFQGSGVWGFGVCCLRAWELI